MYVIKVIPNNELHETIPLLRESNPHISENTLKERQNEMVANNYRCVGMFLDDELIGISGVWILIKYYVGKHVELDNVYLKKEYQGKGLGQQMVSWILDYAKSLGCEASELNCYIHNDGGNKFWSSQGYEAIGYHYQRKLT